MLLPCVITEFSLAEAQRLDLNWALMAAPGVIRVSSDRRHLLTSDLTPDLMGGVGGMRSRKN